MRTIDLSTLSMVGGSGIAETKIPLWWADGASAQITMGNYVITIGTWFLIDGLGLNFRNTVSDSMPSGYSSITLSPNWDASTKFALEATVYSSTSVLSGSLLLWDVTNNSSVPSSEITSNALSATIMRSGQFSLTPNHSYAFTITCNAQGTNYAYNYIDASLIVFPQ